MSGHTRIFSVATSDTPKIAPSAMHGTQVFHYSIPNVQEYGTGVLEDGDTIGSEKIQIKSRCVLISKLNPRKSTLCLAKPQDDLTVASSEFVPLQTGSDADDRFLYWALGSTFVTDYLKSLVHSATKSHQRVQPSEILGLSIFWPEMRTRAAIADYLDRETGDIDAMIGKLDDLSGSLLDRRRTVIMRVTYQDRLRADSYGSEDPLPSGWRLIPLKFAMESAQTGVWGEEPNGGADDVLCARVADFDRVQIRVTEVPTVRRVDEKYRRKCALKHGDILVEKSGGTERNPVGTVVAYEGLLPAVYANFIFRLRVAEGHDPRFWLYALHGSYIGGRTWSFVRQTTGIQNLDVNGFMSAPHAAPGLAEQRRIADHLDEVTGRIDAMLAKVADLKELLIERRAALITDVVTGRKAVV